MDLSEDYADIREQVTKLCKTSQENIGGTGKTAPVRELPDRFIEALTSAGYLAALIPEEYGGAGLPVRAAR